MRFCDATWCMGELGAQHASSALPPTRSIGRSIQGDEAVTVTRHKETEPWRTRFQKQSVEATIGVEPMNKGFADPRVRPLRHVARCASHPLVRGWLPLEDSNLGSRIQSPLSYH